MGTLGTNFSEFLFKIQNFSFTKIRLKMSSVEMRPFCPGGWINTSNLRLMNGSWLSHCKQQLLLFSTASSFSESWRHHHMKHFPHYWPFVRGIHRSPVNSPHKGQWRGPLMFTLICVWINDWVNNREAGDLRRYRAYYDVTLMYRPFTWESFTQKQIFGCL